MRSLAGLRSRLDHVARPRDALVPAVRVRQTVPAAPPHVPILSAICRRAARSRPEQSAAGGRFRVVGRVVEAVFRGMADRFRTKLDLRLPREVENRLPRVLEAIAPAAGHAVVSLAPAEFVNEAPAP